MDKSEHSAGSEASMVEDLAQKLEQIRSVVATACAALKGLDDGDCEAIRLVLVRHADDALVELIDELTGGDAEVEHA